jgi:hypothetical protein
MEEVRKVRNEHAAQFKFDLHEICEDLKQKEKICRNALVVFHPQKYNSPLHISRKQ